MHTATAHTQVGLIGHRRGGMGFDRLRSTIGGAGTGEVSASESREQGGD